MIEATIEKGKTLKLKAFVQYLEQTITLAEEKNWTPLQTIDHLFDLELELRKNNKIERCFRQSKPLAENDSWIRPTFCYC